MTLNFKNYSYHPFWGSSLLFLSAVEPKNQVIKTLRVVVGENWKSRAYLLLLLPPNSPIR